MMLSEIPPSAVAAFCGNATDVKGLAGGNSRSTYCCNGLVLQPCGSVAEYIWWCSVYTTINQQGFRLAEPVRTISGDWIHEGWVAQKLLPGKHHPQKFIEKFEICRLFNESVTHLTKPDFLVKRVDPWSKSDAMVFGDLPLETVSETEESVARIIKSLIPLEMPSQLIHGDFGGNTLWHQEFTPAVIDISPYWRPADFALAVMAVDFISWEKGKISLIDDLLVRPGMKQLLLRAELRRLLENQEHYRAGNKNHQRFLSENQTHTHVVNELLGYLF
jgi:hypothetical protein